MLVGEQSGECVRLFSSPFLVIRDSRECPLSGAWMDPSQESPRLHLSHSLGGPPPWHAPLHSPGLSSLLLGGLRGLGGRLAHGSLVLFGPNLSSPEREGRPRVLGVCEAVVLWRQVSCGPAGSEPPPVGQRRSGCLVLPTGAAAGGMSGCT